MKKELSIILCIFLMTSVAFVSAAGRTTGGDNTSENPTLNAVTAAACETRTTLKERIACRIHARSSANSIEESCRALSLDKQAACTRLQNNARPCYDKQANEKARCLRSHVGLGQGQLNRFAAEDRRSYAALLLYELQERVESKQEQGKITEDQAADLIARIVEMKQSLLGNASIAEVKAQMVAFKTEWRTAMGTTA